MSKTKPSGDYLAALKRRYARASKKERTAILDEFVKTSGYHRKHATALLLGHRVHRRGPIRRPRAQVYGEEDRRAVFKLVKLFDDISSKRLRVAMNNSLPSLRRQGFLRVSAACKGSVQPRWIGFAPVGANAVNAATVLLNPARC